MKFITTLLSVSLLLGMTTFSAPTKANDIASALVGICENVATDNKSRFRKKLKEAGIKLRNIYDGISCGGENLVRYAMTKNAQGVGTFIVGRLPSSHFASSGDLDWANANGHGGSEIAKAIKDR
jgi:hypothetical protein